MTAKAYSRGHEITRKDNKWIYCDTGKLCNNIDMRPCKRCGKKPTKEGYDACLGYLGPSVVSACCGHGVQDPWVTSKKSLGIEEK